MRDDWRDGPKRWDVWSIAAMLLECDMEKDEYLKAKQDKDTKKMLRKHLKKPTVCKYLRAIWEGTILRKKKEEILTIDEVGKLLQKVKFGSLEPEQ